MSGDPGVPAQPAASREPTAAKAAGDLTGQVLASFRDTPDPRLREVLTALVRHLHAFVNEARPTLREWQQAIGYLTAVGQTCDPVRQEFVLLSDVLGVSMLVELLNEAGPAPGATAAASAAAGDGGDAAVQRLPVTASTVLGPFHLTASPPRSIGDTISVIGDCTPLLVEGRVVSTDGTPCPGSSVDVWQCDPHGFYDVQVPDAQEPGNGRGLFVADPSGGFRFVTVVPSHYPIPTDGPVGQLLQATRRHPYRPAHIHFQVHAAGHAPLTTHIFMPESPYLESDAVFAVKPSLICSLSTVDDPEAGGRAGIRGPFLRTEVELVLAPLA
ncbi:MAG: 6-chlorohydroxyquinol-1,2-dioxygenase [Micromonosporaceae bacterium]|nr:6-chlorohydroxyquinol-1,2-dioxygenase [Micromonosporaceae bacterium]